MRGHVTPADTDTLRERMQKGKGFMTVSFGGGSHLYKEGNGFPGPFAEGILGGGGAPLWVTLCVPTLQQATSTVRIIRPTY